MNNHVTQYFDRWFLNQLSREEKARIQHHLDSCPQCRAFYHYMETALTAAGDIPEEVTLPPGFLTRIKARAQQPYSRQPAIKSVFQWVAISLFAIFLGIGMGRLSYAISQESRVIAAWQTELQTLNTQLIMIDSGSESPNGRGNTHEN